MRVLPFAVLVLSIALNPAALHLFLPAIPAIATAFSAAIDPGTRALSFGLAAMALATLGVGPLSDAVGRRPVLLAAGALVFVGGVLSALAPNASVLILGRMLQGVGAAAGPVMTRAVVRDLHGDRDSGSVIARLSVAMIVVTMTAPIVSALLVDTHGWRASLAATSIPGGLLLLGVFWALPETWPAEQRSALSVRAMLRHYLFLARQPPFLANALNVAFSMAMIYAFMAAAPLVTVRVFGLPVTAFGVWVLVVAVGYLSGNIAAAFFGRLIGGRQLIMLGSVLTVLACVLLTVLTALGAWTPASLFLPAALAAAGVGLSMPHAEAAAIGAVPTLTGAASGLTSALVLAVSAPFAQLAGALTLDTPWPLAVAVLVAASLGFTSHVLGRLMHRRRRVG